MRRWIFAGLVATAAIASQVELPNDRENRAENFASKSDHLRSSVRHSQVRRTEKLAPAFEVNLYTEDDVSWTDSFVLSAEISSEIPLPELTLNWKIPDGVRHIEGDVVTRLGPIEPGQVYRSQIKLQLLDSTNRQIYAIVTETSGSYRMSRVTQFNTRHP